MSIPRPITLTVERVREVLDYDHLTGKFRWRVTLSQRRRAGQEAGTLHKGSGYFYIGVDGREHKAHRLAWMHVHGEWPTLCVDHIDGDPANNRLSNLRLASQAENTQNVRRAHRDSRSGFLGVQQRPSGRFFARLSVQGRNYSSPAFHTPEQAHAAYLALKAEHHPFATITKEHASV